MDFLSSVLLYAKVEVRRILHESEDDVNYAFNLNISGTYSGHEKNSGISSRTSPRMSCEAEVYARLISLMRCLVDARQERKHSNSHE